MTTKRLKYCAVVRLMVFVGFGVMLFARPGVTPVLSQTDGGASLSEAETANKAVVHLYFSDPKNLFLTAEERVFSNIERPVDFAKNILEAVIEGPQSGLVRTIPAGTKLRALYVTPAGTAFVDLTDTVKTGQPGGVQSELLTIFSIVNSLVLNMSDVAEVKILINGAEATTLAGHVDLRFPFKANMLLIR